MTCPDRFSVVCIWCAFVAAVLGYPLALIWVFA